MRATHIIIIPIIIFARRLSLADPLRAAVASKEPYSTAAPPPPQRRPTHWALSSPRGKAGK